MIPYDERYLRRRPSTGKRLSSSAPLSPTTEEGLRFAGYEPNAQTFDELSRAACWDTTLQQILGISPQERAELWQRADRFVQENGVAYNAFHDRDDSVRPWQIDLFPLVISEPEWQTLSTGLQQRTRLIQAIVSDAYGEQRLLRDGLLPPELIYGNPGYERAFSHLPRPDSGDLALCGFELARDPSGHWVVMADRLDAVAGPGYALENRLAVSRTLPGAIKAAHIRRLAPFFERLQSHLKSCAFRNVEDPRIVLLSGGPSQSGYFEDVFLAQYLGYLLVEGSDLAVREDEVYVKTVDGFLPVDVIFNRLRESELDPLEVTGATGIGVTGLVNAIRMKNVSVANGPGYGLLESPIWMRFLPTLCDVLLGEALQLTTIQTWWCGLDEDRDYVLANIEGLVVKPAFEYSGGREYIVADLAADARDALVHQIQAKPTEFVAQARIQRASAPTWGSDGFGTGYLALRAFVTSNVGNAEGGDRPVPSANADEPFTVMPGALVRVASKPQPLPLSIVAGTSSKDAWISSTAPIGQVSLLQHGLATPRRRRNQHLVPCRVADNLFWFGRTLEAADFSARLLRSVLARVESDRPNEEITELRALVRALSGCGLIDPGYLVDELAETLPPIDRTLTDAFGEHGPSQGVRSHVNELLRLASNSRDRISADTWQAVRRLDELFAIADQESFIPEDALELLDELIVGLGACSGLIDDGTVRGPGWRFYILGRRIGRAERAIEFLRNVWPPKQQINASILDSILDVMDGRITYRSRYLADLNPYLVLDLLLSDETNPRSLAFQLSRLDRNVESLPRDAAEVGLSPLERATKTAWNGLQFVDLSALVQPGRAQEFQDFLNVLSEQVSTTANLLIRSYLVLSGSARQRDEGPIRPSEISMTS